jgi:hypothetical protein
MLGRRAAAGTPSTAEALQFCLSLLRRWSSREPRGACFAAPAAGWRGDRSLPGAADCSHRAVSAQERRISGLRFPDGGLESVSSSAGYLW